MYHEQLSKSPRTGAGIASRDRCESCKEAAVPEKQAPRQGRGEQGDDRGSTTAVRCEPLSRKESSRTSLSMASAREVLACSTKECCKTLSQRGPERPTQRRECQGSQCTETPSQLPASPQQPNINRTHTGWRSGGSTAWMSRHTGGSRQDTHGTVPPRRGPWIAQSLRTQHLFFVFPVSFFFVLSSFSFFVNDPNCTAVVSSPMDAAIMWVRVRLESRVIVTNKSSF